MSHQKPGATYSFENKETLFSFVKIEFPSICVTWIGRDENRRRRLTSCSRAIYYSHIHLESLDAHLRLKQGETEILGPRLPFPSLFLQRKYSNFDFQKAVADYKFKLNYSDHPQAPFQVNLCGRGPFEPGQRASLFNVFGHI